MQYWDIVQATKNIFESSQHRIGSYGMSKYIIEARPPTEAEIKKAFSILGLTYGDKTNLDKNYKMLARKNHPDLGGDLEKMKEINWAKDILDMVNIVKFDRETEKEKQQINKKMFENMFGKIESLLHRVNKDYENYLSKWFSDIKGEKFQYRAEPYGGRGKVEWSTSDKKTIFIIYVWLSYQGANTLGGSLSSDENIIVSLSTEIFNDNKKYKIKSSEFKGSRLSSELLDPKNLFPEKDVNRIASKTRSGSKMQRRDFVGALIHEFKAKETGRDQWLIPIDSEYDIDIQRVVFNRQAAYTIHYLYQNKKYIPQKGAVGASAIFIPENEFGIKKVYRVVEFLRKQKEKSLTAAAEHVGAYSVESKRRQAYEVLG